MRKVSKLNLTQEQILKLNPLDRPMGYFPTYYNKTAKEVITLREFVSQEFAQQEAPFPEWVFKPYQDRPPMVNPELKNRLESHMLEKSREEIQECVLEWLGYAGKDDFYTAEKSLQGAVTVSAIFLSRRDLAEDHILNGLMCIEADDCSYEEFAAAAKRFGFCAYIGRSRSYIGGFAVIAVSNPDSYAQHFAAAAEWFNQQGIKIDYLDDITRLRGYGYDPEPIINEKAPIYQQLAKAKKKEGSKKDLKSYGHTTLYDTPGYVERAHQLAVQSIGPFTGNLNPYLQSYAAYFRNYGINYDYAAEYLWNKYWQFHPIIRATKKYDKEGFFFRFKGPYKSIYKKQFHTWKFQSVWVERFATDALEQISDIVLKNHAEGYATNLLGPTGIAKTTLVHAILKRFKENEPKTRLVASYPANLAAEQKAKEFSYPENNPLGVGFDIVIYNQYTDKAIVDHLPQFEGVNIPHAKNEKITYLTKKDLFFFDELHKAFIDDFENTDRNFEAWRSSKAIRIAATGTPMQGSSKELNIRDIDIRRVINPNVDLSFVEVIDGKKHSPNDCIAEGRKHSYNFGQSSEMMFNACVQYIDQLSEPGKLDICYINNTKQIKSLQKMFGDNYNIMVLYSDDEIKEGKLWKGLNDFSLIPTDPDKINVLISTSVAYEAIGIKNENLNSIAVFGEKWPHNIEQIIGRPRKVDTIRAYWFLPSRKSKGYYKDLDHYMADQELAYTKAKHGLDLIREVNEFSQYHTGLNPDRIMQDGNALFNPDGSFNKFRAVKQYFRDKSDFESNHQKFAYFSNKENYTINDCGTIAVNPDDRVTKAVEGIKQQKEDDIAQAFNLLRENLVYCMLFVLRSKIQSDLRTDIKVLLNQDEKAQLFDEEFSQWREQVPRDVGKHITSAVTKYIYLSKFFLQDDKFVDIIEANYNSFSKIRKQIEILMLLESDSKSAAHIYSRDKYRKIIQSFDVGREYTAAQIHQRIRQIYQDDKIVRLSKTKSVQIFNLLFDCSERREQVTKTKNKKGNDLPVWTRTRHINSVKTLDSLANTYGLNVSAANTLSKKHYTYCKSVFNLESVQDIAPEMRKVQNEEVTQIDSLSSAISAIQKLKKAQA